jgi:hypothetical protein
MATMSSILRGSWPLLGIILLMGCGSDKQVISATVSRSPDNSWIATTEVVQYGGPGTAGMQIQVSLSPSRQPQERAQIFLANDDQQPAALADGVAVSWQDTKHLRIRYPERVSVDFLAVRASGIAISSDEYRRH